MFNTELGRLSLRKLFWGAADDETPDSEEELSDATDEQDAIAAAEGEVDEASDDGGSPDESASRDG